MTPHQPYTGPLPPGAVDHKLINPRLARVYRRLWEALARRGVVSEAPECGKHEVEMDDTDVMDAEERENEYNKKDRLNTSNNERSKSLGTEEEDHIPLDTSLSPARSSQSTLAMDTTEYSPDANTNNIDTNIPKA